MSRDIPIIFSAPMVLALLAGRKTMTRRLAWRQVNLGAMTIESDDNVVSFEKKGPKGYTVIQTGSGDFDFTPFAPSSWQSVKAGDRLWVRESGKLLREAYDHHPETGDLYRDAGFLHTADNAIVAAREYKTPLAEWIGDCARANRPSIHMPRWASRLTLVVTATKVEPLQSISPQDAWDEGVDRRSRKVRQMWLFGADAEEREEIYKCACVWEFEDLWTRLHGAESWAANPDVVALSFRVVTSNIDAPEARAA